MGKWKRFLSGIPVWMFTGVVVLAILWLTLAPKPLGEEPPRLFPGADKIVHAIMFGGLTITLLFDWQRQHRWGKVGWFLALGCAASASLFGIIIEYAQDYMGLGRGFEYHDIIADTVGSFIFGSLYVLIQNFWLTKS